MHIENIHFYETGDSTFKISFGYSGHSFDTENLLRSASIPECADAIRNVVNSWVDKRADDNYASLVAQFEGKSVDL